MISVNEKYIQNMTDTICIDQKFSTTRLLTHAHPSIDNKPEDKFESMLFLSEYEGRQAEDGLRTQGFFKESQAGKPLITVVTVVFNGEKFLEKTIQSVINQTYDNIEYIIIDGGSTDGTLDILRKYSHVIDYWVSEADQGISDAFNKAVKLSTGDFINFQGDGDGFYTPDSISSVVREIDSNDSILISGRIRRIDESGKPLYISKQPKKFNKRSLLFKMSLPHQGLFTSSTFFSRYGLFDLNNTYCMDYDHLLRAYPNFPEVILVDDIIANWRADGLGNGKTLEILDEYHKIKNNNNVAPPSVLFLINLWNHFKYVLKRVLNAVQ